MKQLKHYIYQTTNLINGKIYIGKHSSADIQNDSYLGSGKYLQAAIRKYGKQNFIRQILYQFETQEQAFAKENQLVNQNLVISNSCYNQCVGGIGGRKNMVSVKDQFGNNLVVLKTDQRYLSGQLKHNCTGMIYAKNQLGITVQITKEQFNSNKNKFTHPSKGIIVVKDQQGTIKSVSVEDPDYISGKLKSINVGKVVVKDKKGTKFQVESSDYRLQSGQISPIHVGHKWINNGTSSKHIPKEMEVPQGWKLGSGRIQSAKIWIHNPATNQQRKLQLTLNIPEGWVAGRLKPIGSSSHNKGKKLTINDYGKREYK